MIFWEENGRGLSQEEEDLLRQSEAPEHREAVIKMRDERRARRVNQDTTALPITFCRFVYPIVLGCRAGFGCLSD